MLAFLSASNCGYPTSFCSPFPSSSAGTDWEMTVGWLATLFSPFASVFIAKSAAFAGGYAGPGGVTVYSVRPCAFSAWTTRIGFGKKSPREGVTL
jgi:hypothetical protein